MIWFRTSPTLASKAATNSKHRPGFLQQAGAAREDGDSWGGDFIFLDILPRHTLARGWTEGISSYFLTHNISQVKAPENSSFNGPVSLWRDEPRSSDSSRRSPRSEEPQRRPGAAAHQGRRRKESRIGLSLGLANEEAFWEVCGSRLSLLDLRYASPPPPPRTPPRRL